MRMLFALAVFLLSSGCGREIFDKAARGTFSGSLIVMWVSGTSGGSGDGKFVYVPDPDHGLRFTRGVAVNGETVHVKTIQPDWMYTDGGSVPRIVQPVKGLNPWGYAPAYMVHDWLFVARKCLNDKQARPTEAKMAGVTFRESYEIMAEMLKTLERDHKISASDLQPGAITWAVTSGASLKQWKAEDECDANRISETHIKQIKARLGIGPNSKRDRVLIDRKFVRPADVVQVIEF